jgi:hypothetical protein
LIDFYVQKIFLASKSEHLETVTRYLFRNGGEGVYIIYEGVLKEYAYFGGPYRGGNLVHKEVLIV